MSSKDTNEVDPDSISENYKSLLKKVIDTAPNLIFVKDREGRFVLCNTRIASLYGTTAEDLLGKRDCDFNPNLDDTESYSKDDRFVIQEKREIFIPEESVTRPDGTVEWFETVKIPLELPSGEVCVLGVATNITKRKELFNQLSQSQKLEALGQLAGGVAHDLNNVLTVILGFASTIDTSSTTERELKDAVRGIKKAVQGASGLTQKLLGFARKGKNVNINLDINTIVEDTVELLARTLENNIEIRRNLKSQRSVILGDPSQIQQVVLNLAINARDAMMKKKGGTEGGLLTIDSQDVVIEKDADRDLQPGSYVKLTVKDTGCGIQPDILHRVFEPFFTTKPSEYGTGLGLAMVYGIVRNHGGKIDIASSTDQGTTIEVYFPSLESKASNRSRVSPRPAKIKTGTGSILLIDDNEEVLEVLSRMLERLGYSVVCSKSREEAIDTFAQKQPPFDLVVMDMMMPGLDALTAITKIREIHETIGIVISTGYAKNESIQKLLSHERTAFLKKPYRLSTLSTLVDSMLDSQEASDPPETV